MEEDQAAERAHGHSHGGGGGGSLSSSRNSTGVNSIAEFKSLDIEAGTVAPAANGRRAANAIGWASFLKLTFQCVGVVYGDIGTSPLYVMSSTFPDGIGHPDDVVGVLSLILYSITLLLMVKYMFIVLQATDNGDGGTFALYSLLCRKTKVGLLPSQQEEDREISNFQLDSPDQHEPREASKVKAFLEKSSFAKNLLLILTMLGTSMVIGDGIFTPSISVLSAVGGLKQASHHMTDNVIAWISVAILIFLFAVQRFGTQKVGYAFAPVLTLWFLLTGGIGIYNLIKYDILMVFKALSPVHIINYFRRNGKRAWISLGGVVLCNTGVEALFADVGHFSVNSIRLSTSALVYPCLILAYGGQASYLRNNLGDYVDPFYKSIPACLYWPMFIVALLAATIASQSMITGTNSIVQQSRALGCFPPVKVVHTSKKYQGQIYIPEVNFALMIACVAVTIGFKTTLLLGNAYGLAVVFVMILTSAFLVLVMLLIWKTHIILILLYVAVVGSVEMIYLSSVLYKFPQGGYLPLTFAAVLIFVMVVWNYVYRKSYEYELVNGVSYQRLEQIIMSSDVSRLPGIALFHSELVQFVPPIFEHYVINVPALHSVLIFVSVRSLPISRVPMEERFLFHQIGSSMAFRCTARYGYLDVIKNEQEPFGMLLVQKLKDFIRDQDVARARTEDVACALNFIETQERRGIVHVVSANEVVASEGSGFWKRMVIDYAYNILKRNMREQEEVFTIHRKQLLKVGMTIEL